MREIGKKRQYRHLKAKNITELEDISEKNS